MADDDPPTEAELAFRRMLGTCRSFGPSEYSRWARKVRAEWIAAHPKAGRPARVPLKKQPKKTHKPLPRWEALDEKE